jgi:hypothetical protein
VLRDEDLVEADRFHPHRPVTQHGRIGSQIERRIPGADLRFLVPMSARILETRVIGCELHWREGDAQCLSAGLADDLNRLAQV